MGRIRIVEEEGPDIFLTQGEYARLFAEYQRSFMFYAGEPPSFEQWLRGRGKTYTTTNVTALSEEASHG